MIMFWIGAALLASGAGAAVLHRAALARRVGAVSDPTLSVYRRALAEIDDLAERGLVAPDDGRASRAEAGRRLLVAADRPILPVAQTVPPWVLIAAAAAAPLAAVGLYLALGTPGATDQPFAGRLARWRAAPQSATGPELAASLRAIAAERPRDPEPLRRLALLQAGLGDPAGAAYALRKALAIAPDRADLLGPLGEIMVWKAGNKVDGEAQSIFRRLLLVDPKSPAARYFLGLADITGGRKAEGLAAWHSLLADMSPSDPRAALLTRDVESVEKTGLPVPASDGQEVPPAAMSTAIRGMVEGLARRLTSHPDDPAGWVRLVRAYGVLGEPVRQAAALTTARKRYADNPVLMAQLAVAARSTPSPAS